MKTIDDYTIGELKELIKQKEKKKWKRTRVDWYSNYDFSENLKEKIILMTHMQSFADRFNEGWVADWKDNDQKKWGVCYLGSFRIDCNYFYHLDFLFGISVKSKEIAKAMLEEFKDELEIYLK